jgi:L-threonylcarbamoyladenylate synthase
VTRILPATAVDEAAGLLRAGELVGMPTETVYGLAGLAFDEAAVARIFATKERPTFDPLIVHIAERAELETVAALDGFAGRAALDRLLDAFWPGPLTVVLPRQPRVPDLVTSGLETVAVRQPAHPLARALLHAVGAPLAAPSANRFGRISPTSAADVVAELGGRIPAVLDGGPCLVGVESTIIGLVGAPSLLRPGGIPTTAIEEILGAPLARGSALIAPGMLPSHYAPRTPLRFLDELPAELPPRLAVLVQAGDPARLSLPGVVVAASLSPDGDPELRARHLFRTLRALDAAGADLIVAEGCPDDRGLGHAIHDRLSRARG